MTDDVASGIDRGTLQEGGLLTLLWGEFGVTPPIGAVVDSYDNALAETVNGYYKTELVRGPARPGLWRTVEDLELATLG
jgi:transposase InsO family protein